jgi:hypothetical protein
MQDVEITRRVYPSMMLHHHFPVGFHFEVHEVPKIFIELAQLNVINFGDKVRTRSKERRIEKLEQTEVNVSVAAFISRCDEVSPVWL